METNNKLLAEFLGYKPNTNGVYPIVCINEGKGWHLETMKFNYDWNWLMQVVDKIESFVDQNNCARYNFMIEQSFIDIIDKSNSNTIVEIDRGTKIKAVYDACVEFVKRYNEQL